MTTDGVVPVQLDVTSATDIAAAAASCGDVTLLVNNAGIGTGTAALADDALDAARREFETNVFGPLALSHAFAPVLAANGGGAIVNVLSVLSWLSMPATAIYCASKAAGWSLTNSLRQELAAQHTQVLGLYVGYMDTDMTAGITAPKSDPVAVADQTLDGVESQEPTRCSPTTSAATSAAHSPVTSSASTHNSPGDRNLTITGGRTDRRMWLRERPAFELESGERRRASIRSANYSAFRPAPVGRLRRYTGRATPQPPPQTPRPATSRRDSARDKTRAERRSLPNPPCPTPGDRGRVPTARSAAHSVAHTEAACARAERGIGRVGRSLRLRDDACRFDGDPRERGIAVLSSDG